MEWVTAWTTELLLMVLAGLRPKKISPSGATVRSKVDMHPLKYHQLEAVLILVLNRQWPTTKTKLPDSIFKWQRKNITEFSPRFSLTIPHPPLSSWLRYKNEKKKREKKKGTSIIKLRSQLSITDYGPSCDLPALMSGWPLALTALQGWPLYLLAPQMYPWHRHSNSVIRPSDLDVLFLFMLLCMGRAQRPCL